MNHSRFLIIAFSLLLLGLFSTEFSNTPTGEVVKKPSFSNGAFTDYVTFTAQPIPLNSRRAFEQDIIEIDLPKDPTFCTLEGTWITDDDPWGRQRGSCHGAKGDFYAYVDENEQYVLNDPGYFGWAGVAKPKVNPPEVRLDSYVLSMYACNNDYYREPRYYVTGRVIDFGNPLVISWNYYNEELTRPAVDFKFTLQCELSPSLDLTSGPISPTLEQPARETAPKKLHYDYYERPLTYKEERSKTWLNRLLEFIYRP